MTKLAPHPGTSAKPEPDVEVLFQEAHQRRRRRRMGCAAVLVVAACAAAAGVALAGGDNASQHPAGAAAPIRRALAKFGPPPHVAWVDYHRGVHIGSLRTHQQRVVSSNGAGPTTPLVVSGTSLFWVAPSPMGSDVMVYDTASGRVRAFAAGTQVFQAVGSSDVFVDDGNDATIARYRLDGSLVKRFELPDGWYLPDAEERGNAAPAIAHGGILLQSQPIFQTQTSGSKPPTLAVWTPATGKVRLFGAISRVVATYANDRSGTSLVAWLPASCGNNCVLKLTDLAAGTTSQITSPLGFGFDAGGGFSPDGRQLAVFAKTNPGLSDPETRLALIDVPTASLRLVSAATISIGEGIAWAQWLPRSGQLIAGGLGGHDGSESGQRNQFLVDSVTLRSTAIGFLVDTERDLNYSAVVLP